MENNDGVACKDKYHFAIVYNAYTNVAYGDCTFLSGCYNWDTCPYIHYTRVPAINPKTFADMIKLPKQLEQAMTYKYGNVEEAVREIASEVKDGREYPAQWINTDIMKFNFRVIGRYDVIMIDPPWSIHMKLPYQQLSDNDIGNLPIGRLQDCGIIFLWVTGRVHNKGIQFLKDWGYKYVDQITWVKVNQINATIATGRTGHWLNHCKETCLVGIKGSPKANFMLDKNSIVEEVRGTSQKPDAIYGIIERMMGPAARKLELFGRVHNLRAGWLTIGNQLPGVNLVEPILKRRYQRYL
ncbi:MT-A70-domain-containing protein, partial [Tricharina praecox]|uniref:MT-A70-domain-containing protein n=1 Tax=Tricharina praecox TaxID=43433 RepID=UPI00221F0697